MANKKKIKRYIEEEHAWFGWVINHSFVNIKIPRDH